MKMLTTADQHYDYPGTVELNAYDGMRGTQSETPKVLRLVEVHGEDAAREQIGHYMSGMHLALDAESEVARKLQALGYIIPKEPRAGSPATLSPFVSINQDGVRL